MVDGGNTTEKYYFGPIEYNGSTLEAIYHEEGRAVPNGNGGYDYEYAIRGHLGSTRVMFQMVNGVATLIEEHHNYPFGMELSGPAFVGGGNLYRYTGKEWESDLDLGLYDFGARWYDPAAARWWGVDAFAEERNGLTPFNYAQNNPILRIDPDGNLDHDYKIGQNGNIELIRKTEDNHDVLYATNNNGEVDESKSIEVEKGILDNVQEDNSSGGITFHYMKIRGDDKAKPLFEFMAINSKVEISNIKYGINLNYISTSHRRTSEPGSGKLLKELVTGSYTVREHIHSHPGNNSTPSGFGPKTTYVPGSYSKDRGLAEWAQDFSSGFVLKLFLPGTQEYIKYDTNGIIKN